MRCDNPSDQSWSKIFWGRVSQFVSVGGRSILIASLLTTALLTAFKEFGVLEALELFSFDHLVRRQSDQALDSRLLIIGMTEADIQQYGWPLSDQTLATLLQKLQQHQPRVIGLDLYRSTPRPPGSIALTEQLSANNLVAIMNVGSDSEVGEVPPPPQVPWNRIGFNDLVIDSDGILRRSLLFVDASEKPYYSFALRVALAYWGNQPAEISRDRQALYLKGTQIRALSRNSGGYQTADADGYQTLLRYRSRRMPAQQLTVSQVLSDRINPEVVRGRVVLVGTVAPSLKDQFYTPYSAGQATQFTMSGVVIHAQIISQLLDVLSGPHPVLYRFLPQWGESAWLLGWTLLVGLLVWQIQRPILLFSVGSLVLIALVGLGWLGLVNLIWLPIAEPIVGVLITGGLITTQKLIYRSTHDSLTGLPGREVFLQHVQRALQVNQQAQDSCPVIVAFLDIDRFKLINKSLGHLSGDFALLTLVKRLSQVLPQPVRLARVGGDEFAILFQGLTQAAVEQKLDSLQQTLSEPFYLKQQRLAITASIGLAVTQKGYNHQPEDLLRDAHTAMYRAKALGTSRYEVFATGMLMEAVNRLHLESNLLDALERKEFCLYYQPIVCLSSGQITGFEALVRWHRPDHGFVVPNAFIPIAEETGLIVPLGQWIFQEACQQLKIWQKQFPQRDLKMSVNLSSRQFKQADLVHQVENSLQSAGISGQNIRLEITESVVMENVQVAIDLMLHLRELGLQLSIDDFGTGYSSLSYLHRFPIDILKVDKSFVGRMEQSTEDREIVHTIITLGHKLGMAIVAEGIENRQQVTLLQSANCQYGQGYFFAKPLSPEDATNCLRDWNLP